MDTSLMINNDAHRALRAAKARKARPEKLLADTMTDPKVYRLKQHKTLKLHTPVPQMIKSYDKIVLDEDAARLATRIAGALPRDVLHMLDVTLPPSTKTWIEWPSQAMLDERRKMQAEGLSINATDNWGANRPEWARCGIMVETVENGYRIACLEHSDRADMVFEWPVQFVIPKDSLTTLDPFEMRLEKAQIEMRGKAKAIDQAAIVWGYGRGTKGLSNLKNRGTVHVPAHMTLLLAALCDADTGQMKKIINETTLELTGLPRLAVAILAMLHTSMIIDEPTRPPGRFVGKGGTPKPYSERRAARLVVPGRVRNVEQYVRNQIKDEGDRIRKRYHKVKAHFRHSTILPLNGEGWVRCMCPGRPLGRYWHKKIDEHWRGDESLGTVTRSFTLVSGPTDEDKAHAQHPVQGRTPADP